MRELIALCLVWIALWPVAASAKPVTIPVSGGVRLSADLDGTGETAVLIVHDGGGDRSAWADFGAQLVKAGHRVLRIDLRGHGQTAGPADDAAWAKAPADVDAAIAWMMRQSGVTRGVVLGAGVGATLALTAAGDVPGVIAGVIVSPTISAHGHSITTALDGWGGRPLLLFAATGDAVGTRAAQAIAKKAGDAARTVAVAATDRGPRLVSGPDARATLIDWLASTSAAAATSPTLKAGDFSETETTGTPFGK